MAKKKITLSDYMACQEPQKVIDLLHDEGFEFDMPKNANQLSELIDQYIASDGEHALEKLAEIHPDRELIMSGQHMNFNDAATMAAMREDYANPFNRVPYKIGQPLYQNADGGCGCHQQLNATGPKGCGCGCQGKCGSNQLNATGPMASNQVNGMNHSLAIFAMLSISLVILYKCS